MIDVHCHILFGIDDSITTKEESIEMLTLAIQDGVHVLCATSHIHTKYPNTASDIWKPYQELQTYITENNIDMELIVASELFLSEKTKHFLHSSHFVPYENSSYILVEFPWKGDIDEEPVDELIEALLQDGYIPVIAHPERYGQVQKEFSLLYHWKAMGCLLQVNRTSVLGYDKLSYAQSIALRMLQEDLVDVIASDSHGPHGNRKPILSDVYQFVKETYGEQRAKRYFEDTPNTILNRNT